MKKKMMKKVVSFALAMVMVLTSVLVGGVDEAKAATPEEITLKNADFADGKTDWNCVENETSSSWMYGYAYASDSYITKPENANDYCLKFESTGEGAITLSQEIGALPKGLYTVSVPVMGGKASVTIKLEGSDIAAMTSETIYLDNVSGWNRWATSTASFNLENDIEDAVLTVTVYCWAGAWGYVDRVDFEGANNDGYIVTLTSDKTSVEKGGTVNLTATATYNGQNVTLGNDYKLWFWEDETDASAPTDAWCSDTTGTSLTNVVTLPSAGTYKINAELKDANDNQVAIAQVTLTATEPVVNDTYTVEVSADKDTVTVDGTITLTAVVKKNGEVLTDLGDLKLWFWPDTWKDGHSDGLNNENNTNIIISGNTGSTLTDTATIKTVGKYYVMAELKDANGNWLAEDCVTITATAASSGDTNPDGGNTTTPDNGTTNSDDSETKVDEKPVVIELENSSFSASLDGTWTGEIAKGEWQDGNDMQVLSYSTDSYLELPSYVGTSGLKFNMEQGNTMTILQWVDSLKAGTYTITAPVMGENTDVYLVLGDKEIKATSLSGYNNWTKAKATFKITEDMADVKVGFKLVATSSGDNSWSWGWIDSIQLIKTVPSTGDTTNAYAYVLLMMAGLAIVGYSVKRNKVQF